MQYTYDAETGLYHLESRYYDPAIERSINGDALVNPGQGLLGNNMFAYCGNKPVLLSDLSSFLGVSPYRNLEVASVYDPLYLTIGFVASWYAHISEGCDFDCKNKTWPTA